MTEFHAIYNSKLTKILGKVQFGWVNPDIIRKSTNIKALLKIVPVLFVRKWLPHVQIAYYTINL